MRYIYDDSKWNAHIESSAKSVSTYYSILRKLNYILNSKNLEKLYLVCIFMYMQVNRGSCNSDKLEKLQFESCKDRDAIQSFLRLKFYIKERDGQPFLLEEPGILVSCRCNYSGPKNRHTNDSFWEIAVNQYFGI